MPTCINKKGKEKSGNSGTKIKFLTRIVSYTHTKDMEKHKNYVSWMKEEFKGENSHTWLSLVA